MRTSRAAWSALALGLVVPAGTAGAADGSPVAWLHTSGNLNGDAPSTWGFNAVDGKPTTAWCAEQGQGAWITVGFTRPVQVTHVGVLVGALKGTALDTSHARVAELEMSDGLEKRVLTLQDNAEVQELQLQPAITVQRLKFTVKDVFPGALPSSPICIGEIVLKNGRTEWLGEVVSRQARGIPRPVLSLTGVWLDNPSAPERILKLAMDGTFTWTHEPILEGEPQSLAGTWEVHGKSIQFKPRKGAAFSYAMSRERVAGKSGSFEQLILEGSGGPAAMAVPYQPSAQ